jgi:hypothetical protein
VPAAIDEIVVGHVGDVYDARVADVDVAEISATNPVPGIKRLTPPQRTPAHATTESKSEAHTPTRSAEPGNKRGRIKRSNVERTRHPSPVAVVVNPTAVVEGSESPGCIVNPCPTPGRNPHPVAVVIRRPSRCYGRHPHRPIRRNLAPHAIVIEVFISDRVAWYVAG